MIFRLKYWENCVYLGVYFSVYPISGIHPTTKDHTMNESIIDTPFYTIIYKDGDDACHIAIKSSPIKKVVTKHHLKDVIQYIYPTRKLSDDGNLLDDNYNDEIQIFIESKKLGKKLSIWDSVSCEKASVYASRLEVYLTSLITKTYSDYTDDKVSKLANSLSQQIIKLFK